MSIISTNASLPLGWLYVDFNSYFASVEQQYRPETRGKPLIVVPVDSDYTSAIAASYEAKAYGIKTGTRVADAKRMCPELQWVLARHELYVEIHEKIVKEVHRHIPVAHICSIDEVACRLMLNEQSVEAVTDISHRIKRGLVQNIGEYIRCSIGVAPNKYLAKIATDMKKPDGLIILQASDLPDRLFALRLNDLPGIGHNMEKRLHKHGVYTVEQLWRLSPKHMRAIWHHIWGEKLWYMMRGHDIPDVATQRSTVGHSHVLAPELRPLNEAYYVLRRLTMKAASRLRRLGYDASSMHVLVKDEQGRRHAIDINFPPASDTCFLLHTADVLWKSLCKQTGVRKVKKLSISLHKLHRRQDKEQLYLLGELQRNAKQDKVSKAMDIINQRFGRDTILQGMLPSQGKGFSGTKIAFTRIPEMQEFQE